MLTAKAVLGNAGPGGRAAVSQGFVTTGAPKRQVLAAAGAGKVGIRPQIFNFIEGGQRPRRNVKKWPNVTLMSALDPAAFTLLSFIGAVLGIVGVYGATGLKTRNFREWARADRHG